jgi:glycosyltransferase involved in cell wall biosynthesis
MRIAVWHNLPSGGGKRALYDHVRGLLARGHEIEVWRPPTADRTYLPLADLVPEHVVALEWPPRRRVGDVLNLRLSTERRLAAMDRHCRRCAHEINQGRFDVVFANSCQFFRTTPLGRYVRAPKALYLQEPYRWLYEAMPELPWLARPKSRHPWWFPDQVAATLRDVRAIQDLRIQARAEVENARVYDAILVNSLFSRESVERAYGLDAQVCYLGIDTARFADRGLPRENAVIGIGAFVPEKNIKLVIEALAQVEAPRPRLIWIGNVAIESYLDELRQLAAARGVDFTPRLRIGDDEVQDLLNRARMMVYAPRLEPFGLAPLEANACGLPVVGVAEGGVRETVVDGVTGLLVEHDPSALARAITRLRDDPTYAETLGDQGRQRVAEHWSLSAAIDRLEQRLIAVTHAPHGPGDANVLTGPAYRETPQMG